MIKIDTRIPKDLYDKIISDAESQKRSKCAMMRLILQAHYDVCQHEMVICDAQGRVPLTGEPFRGDAHAICHKCGFRP